MSGVPLVEGFMEATNPASFARNKEVLVFKRGTKEQAQLYADEALSEPMSQPLVTDAGGRPRHPGSGLLAWVAAAAYDIEIDGEVVPWNPPGSSDLSGYQQTSEKGAAGGYASLEAAGKVPAAQLPSAVMEYQGTWNASTNSPKLEDGKGSAGDVYRVSVAGERNLGSGSVSFAVGDYAVYNGSTWEKSDTTDAVASVAGKTGAVTLAVGDISGAEATANKDTTGTLGTSDTKYPSQKAVKTYADTKATPAEVTAEKTRAEAAEAKASPTGLLWTPQSAADLHEVISASERVSMVADPLGSGAQVFKVECNNADISPITPTGDPRAQCLSPSLLTSGADIWIHGKLLCPTAMPAIVEGKWFQLLQIFGPPFGGANGAATWTLQLKKEGGKEYPFWQRNNTYGYDIPWEGENVPLERNVWLEYYLRIRFANLLYGGAVELWWQGKQIEFFHPGTSYNPFGHEANQKSLAMSTEDAGNNEGPNQFYFGNYRQHNTTGMEGTVTIYHWPPKIGLTKLAVT
jgi:hypothetical protein